MESWFPTPIDDDQTPALTRGLTLLSLLNRDGACSLESLVSRTRWPKTSVLRILQTLCQGGAVQREEATKRYTSLVQLHARASQSLPLSQRVREAMVQLCQQIGHTSEWFRLTETGLIMSDRAEPDEASVMAVARIGHQRDLYECDAMSLICRAHTDMDAPTRGCWYWDANACKKQMSASALRQQLPQTRLQAVTVDPGVNSRGVRRYATALFKNKKLWGILTIAQAVSRSADEPDPAIILALAQIQQTLSDE